MAMPGGNPQNLRPVRTSEEARARGSRGGKASVKARREKKSQQQLAKELLDMPLDKGRVDDIKYLKDVAGKNLTAGQAALIVQMQKAIQEGDAKAYAIVRDTAGEQPVQRIELNAEISQAEEEVAGLIAKMKARHAAE